jgi:hypothetical protein
MGFSDARTFLGDPVRVGRLIGTERQGRHFAHLARSMRSCPDCGSDHCWDPRFRLDTPLLDFNMVLKMTRNGQCLSAECVARFLERYPKYYTACDWELPTRASRSYQEAPGRVYGQQCRNPLCSVLVSTRPSDADLHKDGN